MDGLKLFFLKFVCVCVCVCMCVCVCARTHMLDGRFKAFLKFVCVCYLSHMLFIDVGYLCHKNSLLSCIQVYRALLGSSMMLLLGV